MANILTAGNSSNGGTAISTDTSGTLNIVTGSGSGATAVTVDGSQNVAFSNAVSVTGNNLVVSASSVLGYGTGAGGTVTQATSKATSVTLNKPTGKITMNNAALAAGASVGFTFNNSLLTTNDTMIINIQTATDASKYVIAAEPYAGAAAIIVRNVSSGSLSEALVLTYTVIRGATS